MGENPQVSAKTVAAVSVLADLRSSPERQAQLAPLLSGLIAAANELSARMAKAAGHPRSIPPMLGFPER